MDIFLIVVLVFIIALICIVIVYYVSARELSATKRALKKQQNLADQKNRSNKKNKRVFGGYEKEQHLDHYIVEHEHNIENHAKTDLEQLEEQELYLHEPSGFWTKKIWSEKLDFIMAMIKMGELNKGKYWQNYIEAQKHSQGKDKDRGI